MRTLIVLFAVLAVAIANPLPLVQLIVNIEAQEPGSPIIPRPIPEDTELEVIPPDQIQLPHPQPNPSPVVLPEPVIPGGIVPEPVQLPAPVIPGVILPAPLPQPVFPDVIIPAPVIAP
ncbi:hypothetical protein RR46_06082 [Papilio xuthus]|uniref:Cuticular protein n=1 Tax=Papilio xuthus TaxID=66420 RepID=A0A194QE95_PAPXU|nr:hypothetical protein RR46_06082 [Papilio xuthus]